jgi:hypothetical protein
LANIKDINIGDTVRFVQANTPDWFGQEGVVTHLDNDLGHVHYKVTKAAPGHEHKFYNKIGRETYILASRLEVIEKALKFKVGDRIKIVSYYGRTDSEKVGATGKIVQIDKHDRKNFPYRVEVDEQFHNVVTYRSDNSLWLEESEMELHVEKLPEPVPAVPAPEFKVGDTVYLTDKGRKKDGLPALKKRLKAEVTRVQWYSRSKCYGYYLDIPGVSDTDSLSWVSTYEFYDGEFQSKKSLKKASTSLLEDQKIGTVVTDCEGDKWVMAGHDTWVHAIGSKDTVDLRTIDLVEEYGPLSLI